VHRAQAESVRRCWRFGQKRKVTAHIITSTLEGAVVANIKRKEKEAQQMADQMVKFMAPISSAEITGLRQTKTHYTPKVAVEIPAWI